MHQYKMDKGSSLIIFFADNTQGIASVGKDIMRGSKFPTCGQVQALLLW